MLKVFKELLVGARDMSAKPAVITSGSRGPAGYYMPASAEQLLSTASRKQCLQQLWENCALPKDLYEQFYLQPLKQLMTLMQVLPATLLGEYAREGGWLISLCRRRRMRCVWPKGTCYLLGPHRKNNLPRMYNGMSWCITLRFGATCRC